MPFDAQFALDTMLPLAEAAYDDRLLPKDWKLVKEIQPDKFGLIATRGDITVVSIRGTESQHEWMEDFDAKYARCHLNGPALYVHCGFQEVYLRIRADIREAVNTLNPANGKLWITGHSLGAALAVLCAFDLAAHQPLTYTWAGPRVGTDEFAKEFNRRVPDCYRITNRWDVVPDVPPAVMGYCHVGQQIPIDGGSTDSLHVAHSLSLSYGPGLEKLLKLAA